MPANWRVRKAERAVNEFHQFLHKRGYKATDETAVSPIDIAEAYIGCDIVYVADLTDRKALEHLAGLGLDTSDEPPKDDPLAGGLYVTECGSNKWIFVESSDIPQRQRWTVAHELGHLSMEALPQICRAASMVGDLVAGSARPRIARFGRCALRNSPVDVSVSPSLGQLSEADKRELDANDFAAELLMPYSGIKRAIGEMFGATGFRTDDDIRRFVRELARRYDVSRDAASRRVTADLRLEPQSRSGNRDLFADL